MSAIIVKQYREKQKKQKQKKKRNDFIPGSEREAR